MDGNDNDIRAMKKQLDELAVMQFLAMLEDGRRREAEKRARRSADPLAYYGGSHGCSY